MTVYVLVHRGHEGLIYQKMSSYGGELAYELYLHQLDGGDGALIEYNSASNKSRMINYKEQLSLRQQVNYLIKEEQKRTEALRASEV